MYKRQIDWFGDASRAGEPIDFDNDGYPGMCDDFPEYCASGGGAYTCLLYTSDAADETHEV